MPAVMCIIYFDAPHTLRRQHVLIARVDGDNFPSAINVLLHIHAHVEYSARESR